MGYAFDYAARSVTGLVRASNQDSGYASPNLVVVADGMGGHAGGDVASTIAVEILRNLDHPGHTPATALADLENALDHSQLALCRASETAPQLQGLGTTVVCLLRTETTLVMAHMGDSRAYLLRNGELAQVTVDHTFVQHLVDIGRITPAEAETHPQRNVVMRVLSDFDLDLNPDVSVREAKLGDRWLLCSDGLSGFLTGRELATILATESEPTAAADALIARALTNQSTDNITAVVVDIVDPAIQFTPVAGTENDPAATQVLTRKTLAAEVVGAAATGGPLPNLVAAVVAGDDWDDDHHDDAEPMSDWELLEHGLTPAGTATAQAAHRERMERVPTGPTPIVPPQVPANTVIANPAAANPVTVNPAVVAPDVTAADTAASLSPATVDHQTGEKPPAVNRSVPAQTGETWQPQLTSRVDPLYHTYDDDPRARQAPRRRPWLSFLITMLAAALLGLTLWLGYSWTQQQYFVGIYQSRVAVFRGIPQDLGPIRLHHPILLYDIDANTFPNLFVGRLNDTIRANDYYDAVERAERLIIDARTQVPHPRVGG